jgi:hypothetical protein
MDFKVRDWFPCDFARNDDAGKPMYIGVYTDEIVIRHGQFPAILPQLSFIFRLEGSASESPVPIHFSVSTPNGDQAAKVDGTLPAGLPTGTRLNLSFALAPAKFDDVGKYRVSLSIGAKFSFNDHFTVSGGSVSPRLVTDTESPG